MWLKERYLKQRVGNWCLLVLELNSLRTPWRRAQRGRKEKADLPMLTLTQYLQPWTLTYSLGYLAFFLHQIWPQQYACVLTGQSTQAVMHCGRNSPVVLNLCQIPFWRTLILQQGQVSSFVGHAKRHEKAHFRPYARTDKLRRSDCPCMAHLWPLFQVTRSLISRNLFLSQNQNQAGTI